MYKISILNGYRLIYLPKHKKAMPNGYVYEHVLIAEEFLERELTENEVVHHLNGDVGDNRISNLLVLEQSQHAKLHAWINGGYPGLDKLIKEGAVVKTKTVPPKFCKICERTLQNNCSEKCKGIGKRVVDRPTLEEIENDLKTMSMVKVGKKYGVSDNAVRKWIIEYKKSA